MAVMHPKIRASQPFPRIAAMDVAIRGKADQSVMATESFIFDWDD
jgi:hypothetical protein